ncbi:hypothetical protein HID58_060003 [Brassica napus]|uniref:Uncharacterized protein n=2 Tax=Brassica TaxID=3705 RepID=A0ABQ7ZUJ4_BRANA|nr:hypothetical protein HID58_060003 [Brassica napus]
MDSSVCHSDSSSDPCEESDFNLMAPLPLTYAPAAPILIGPASSVVDDDLTEWRRRYSGTNPAPAEGESTVLRARQLPLDRRQVNFLVSETALLRSSLWSKYVSSHILCLFLVPDGSFCTGNMSGSIVNDPFAAHQEAAKVMSAIKGSASRTTSGDEVVITGSRRKTMVKVEPSFSSQGKKSKANLNSKVFPQDGVVLPAGDPLEAIQVLQGGLLQRQVSEEREQRTARELEICDLKDKVRELEKVAETSSADTLAASRKNQELEEEMETLKREMVMAVNGARIVTRWELMREWLNKQSGQWDLIRALDHYKIVILEEAKYNGIPPPSFEDEPAIPPASEMDVDSSVKP